MEQPGGEDAAASLIQGVEDQARGGQQDQRAAPDEGIAVAGNHPQMVHREENGAEQVGKGPGGEAFQVQEGVAPEEEFLQHGVDQGDVGGHIYKIFRIDAALGGHLPDGCIQIEKPGNHHISPGDHHKGANAQSQGDQQLPFLQGKEGFQLIPGTKQREIAQGHTQKQQQLEGGFHCVGRLHHPVHKGHHEGADHGGRNHIISLFHGSPLLFPNSTIYFQ